MKAIKDCEWEVRIWDNNPSNHTWLWGAEKIDLYAAGLDETYLGCSGMFNKEYLAKRNWERFAKLTKIKKWKYKER